MKTAKTILEEQAEIEAAFDLLPTLAAQLPAELKPLVKLSPRKGFRAEVSLRSGTAKESKQVRRNAPAERWSPDSGLIAISYKPCSVVEPEVNHSPARAIKPMPSERAGSSKDPVQDI